MTEALSPIAAAIAELLAAVGSTCANRISPHKPATGWDLGPGAYIRHANVGWLDGPPRPRMPVRDVTLIAKFYGTNEIDAEAFGLLGEAVFANAGARKAESGLGVWFSQIVSSGPDEDPDTHQPLWAIVFRYPTTILAIP